MTRRRQRPFDVPNNPQLLSRWKEGTNNRTSAQDAPVPRDTQVRVALFWSSWIFLIFWAWDFPGLRARTFLAWWLAAVDKLRAHKCQLRAQRRFLRKSLEEEDGRMVSLDLTAPWDTLTNHLLKAQVSLKYSRLEWKTCPQERTSHPSPCWRLCCLFKAFWCKTI